MTGKVILGDNMDALPSLADGSVDMIYIDPPFNTGRAQSRTRLATSSVASAPEDASGDRTGFKGRRYVTVKGATMAFDDRFAEYLAFLEPRMREAWRVLAADGSLFLHVDCREVHYCRLLLDEVFGPESFMNEIIWAYDYGARSRRRWPAKHDNILWYAKNPERYTFNYDEMDRIPYMAPGLVTAEKAARGKTPTDVWWHTIVPTSGSERTGYPTQKPLGVVSRIVKVHSRPGDVLLDFFAGSGTLGVAAASLGRRFILIDSNPEAAEVMARRLREYEPELVGFGSCVGTAAE